MSVELSWLKANHRNVYFTASHTYVYAIAEQSKIYDYCVLISISFEFELNACSSAHCLTIIYKLKQKCSFYSWSVAMYVLLMCLVPGFSLLLDTY